MTGPLYFEELQVGNSWISPRRTLTETDVVLFAGLTGDFDPLHMDHHFAEQTLYRKPLAHGLLGMALAAGLAIYHPRVSTSAFVAIRNWRFVAPIHAGDTVYAVTSVDGLRNHGRRNGLVTWQRRLCNQSGQTMQEGVFETLVAKAQTGSHDSLRNPARPAVPNDLPDDSSDGPDVIPFAA